MKNFRAEDYALVVAHLGFVAWIAILLAAPCQGHHFWDISIYTSIRLAKYQNYTITVYGPLIFFAKLSVLLQLQHIFVVSRRQPIFFIIQALIWANLAFYLVYFFIDIFQCVPRRKIWEPNVPGRCIATNVLLLAPAGINIVSDGLILVLPIVLIFRLKMTLKNKLAIVAVFSSSLFAVVSSIMRLVYSIKLTETDDFFWAVYPVAMWAAAELATVIIAATFPTMPRLWTFVRTGDRNALSNERRSTPHWPRKPRQQNHVVPTSLPGDDMPPKRAYMELRRWKSKSRKDELETQITRTDSYEVTSQKQDSSEFP